VEEVKIEFTTIGMQNQFASLGTCSPIFFAERERLELPTPYGALVFKTSSSSCQILSILFQFFFSITAYFTLAEENVFET